MPRKAIDITGQKFGRLTAVRSSAVRNYWWFVCDCGLGHHGAKSNAVTGRLSQCHACASAASGPAKRSDLTGKKFGSLAADRFLEVRGKSAYWLFSCDCGEQYEARASDVRSGHIHQCTRCSNTQARESKTHDLRGRKFGFLLVVSYSESDKKWVCLCDCGQSHKVSALGLKRGSTSRCGSCIHYNQVFTEGEERAKVSWCCMRSRCFNPKNINWKYYGAVGVTICDRWMDFRNFLIDMGPRPEGMSIDRIDPFGNYEPSNCRYATALEQANNKRGESHRLYI